MASPQTILTNLAITTTSTGVALWGATQWTAAELGFHPALGSPWVSSVRSAGLCAPKILFLVDSV